jgi:nucleoporin NUP82
MTALPISLSTLGSHSIFTPPQIVGEGEDDWEVFQAPSDDVVGLKSSRMVIRDKDLFLAVGQEVRATTLGGEAEVHEGVVGSYKVRSGKGRWLN